jgi:hypothetical protein
VFSTTTTPAQAGGKSEARSDEENAGAIFDRIFAEGGTLRANIIAAFESSVEDLPRNGREDRMRDVAKAAALSTARCHGNIIETGRVLLGNIDELGNRLGLDVRRCKDQVMLGLAEGACQVGPIVYSRYLDIASEYRDNADDWIAKNKRRAPAFETIALPVIVPFEAELTLTARPFKESAAPQVEAAVQSPTSIPEVASTTVTSPDLDTTTANSVQSPTVDDSTVEKKPEVTEEKIEEKPEEAPAQWSRPKGKGFFARLSNVMGSLFGRG